MARSRRKTRPMVMILRGLVARCPNCGGGRLFRRWWTMKERCPTCGMRFEREEGFFLGAYVVNFGLVLLLLAVWVIVGVIITLPDPPVAVLTIIGMVGCVVVAVGFYPMSRTIWSAIDLIMTPPKAADFGDGPAPKNRPRIYRG